VLTVIVSDVEFLRKFQHLKIYKLFFQIDIRDCTWRTKTCQVSRRILLRWNRRKVRTCLCITLTDILRLIIILLGSGYKSDHYMHPHWFGRYFI